MSSTLLFLCCCFVVVVMLQAAARSRQQAARIRTVAQTQNTNKLDALISSKRQAVEVESSGGGVKGEGREAGRLQKLAALRMQERKFTNFKVLHALTSKI